MHDADKVNMLKWPHNTSKHKPAVAQITYFAHSDTSDYTCYQYKALSDFVITKKSGPQLCLPLIKRGLHLTFYSKPNIKNSALNIFVSLQQEAKTNQVAVTAHTKDEHKASDAEPAAPQAVHTAGCLTHLEYDPSAIHCGGNCGVVVRARLISSNTALMKAAP